MDKKSRETNCSPSRSLSNCRGLALVPLCLGFEFRSHCQSLCSDFTVALSKTEKTSTVRGGDSVLFVVLRYVSIRFISFHFTSVLFPVCLSFSADCVSHCPLTPHFLRDATVLTHKFALICCKIISFIYVLPFTWRYAVDNLFKRRHRRGATNLNKINYQTVTLTYRPGSQAARQAGGGGRLLAIQLPRSKS